MTDTNYFTERATNHLIADMLEVLIVGVGEDVDEPNRQFFLEALAELRRRKAAKVGE